MKLFPAIDLYEGKAVRLFTSVFNGDIIYEQSMKWACSSGG